MSEFSVWLASQLENQRIRPSSLAQLTGISKASIYNYLKGLHLPGDKSYNAICIALGKTLEGFQPVNVGHPKGKKNKTTTVETVEINQQVTQLENSN